MMKIRMWHDTGKNSTSVFSKSMYQFHEILKKVCKIHYVVRANYLYIIGGGISCERDETIEHTKWTRNTIIIWIFEHDEGTWLFLNRYFHCEKMFSLNFCINWSNRNDRNFQLLQTEAVNMELSKQFRSINKPMNFEWPNSAFLMGFSRFFVCPESLE